MLIVVSPHLDDAVLSLWSLLTENPGSTVVTTFAGVPEAGRPLAAWDRRCGYSDPAEASQRRRAADVEALARCGATAVHLDHLDVAYRSTPPAETQRTLTRELRELFAQASAVHLPVGLGLHPDHRLVGRAALAAVDRSRTDLHVYADQPYASVWGWPKGLEDDRPLRLPPAWARFPLRHLTRTPEMQWSAALAHHGLPRTLPLVVHRLRDDEVDRKLRALEPYQEQLDQLSYGPYGTWSLRQAMAYEAWWDVSVTSRSSAS